MWMAGVGGRGQCWRCEVTTVGGRKLLLGNNSARVWKYWKVWEDSTTRLPPRYPSFCLVFVYRIQHKMAAQVANSGNAAFKVRCPWWSPEDIY